MKRLNLLLQKIDKAEENFGIGSSKGFLENVEYIKKLNEAAEQEFIKLYTIMYQMEMFKDILEISATTPSDLKKISDTIRMMGFAKHGIDYLPVSLVSLWQPLAVILGEAKNKELFLKGNLNKEELKEASLIVREAIMYL